MTLSINVDVHARSWNRDVIRKLAKADKRFLHWYGGALRKSIRRNVRTRKSTSKPGKGPTHWTGGNSGLRLVAYDVNNSATVVTVGVLKFSGSRQQGTHTAAKILEEGGTTRRRFIFVNTNPLAIRKFSKFKPKGIGKKHLRIVFSRTAKPRNVRYKKRPFVKPAFDKINEKVAERYARAVSKAMS